MIFNVRINEELIFEQAELSSQEEAISLLADALKGQGYVKKDYKKAILRREKEYPTGLPSLPPMVAIPHADHNLVKQNSIAVATLKKPVVFYNMESPEQKLDIYIVIMLAISEPHGQVEMLQKIITLIQNKQLKDIILNSNKKRILSVFKKEVLTEYDINIKGMKFSGE
ncbi:PTS sugar transporter subunit IIA [Streptococcus pantholopis]|uniref:PTS galactitol transporter subunit IIA n=1 Tax=Streptococcus pantholopis TaxID=1811193 RepID=A0A172Q7V1_9STRE|nr:PTS sugar transporter subunit IIA [Streptococcus pantholopis]AND79530.1 PTS galactitol transporter subunit IIA [Streptococcus pantholopis]